MLKGLTQAGLASFLGPSDFIDHAAKYGFEAIDYDAKELYNWVKQEGVTHIKAVLEERKVVIGAISLPVEWQSTEDDFRYSVVKLASYAATAADLGCTRCCTYILPSTDYNPAHFMALATHRLRACAQILNRFGISLGVEFVGPHHYRTHWKHPFIWTIAETLDFIDAIGEPNVGLLFDSYHWYTNEATIEDILTLRAEQIVHVHLNDARHVPIAEVRDNDRLYPGEGVIDLTGFVKALHQIGYQGVVAQEVLTPKPPKETNENLLRRSADGFAHIFAALDIRE
ncbi:sugar phosphate isomerase/epimerase family protein [Paenibacillus anseongense]|uniref:sugar phosphate isomerase/epimerase family protein n=1 Tax=Paenibacillus TaxID=44249 RepID=UPI002DBD80E1|nr:sugar phosphate isomerase/epimerase family protein [Paenibacillus anseongense]MEC0267256.1 sugar phosphate isomerase/epimerase [Paenibacillus anseongense]